jgi:hypothetical protein
LQIFAAASLLLIPWTIFLSQSLPGSHLDRRWNVAWVGFDIALLLALALTAYLGWRKSGWTVISATAAATLLIVDSWFDMLTATSGREYLGSIASAFFVELPLAVLALWVAYHIGKQYFGSQKPPAQQEAGG